MHLLESYVSTTRLKYTKPLLFEHFYPLPFNNKYIVMTTGTTMAGKTYPYWEEVLDIVKQFLKDIKIIQLGGKDDITNRHIDLDLRGKTNLYEFNYLVKNSILSLSPDTAQMHIAGTYNIPLIALFGLTDPRISGAFFGDKDKQIYLEPNRSKFPPTFNPHDQSVANVKPEEVAKAILKLLNIAAPIPLVTKYFGSNFLYKTLDLVPNMLVNPQQFAGSIINIRADQEFNEDGIYQNVVNYKSTIITQRPLNVEILKQLKPNIMKILYILDDNHNLEFVKQMRKAGIPYELISYKDQEWINSLKFDYCDYGIIFRKEYSTLPAEITGPHWFKTNRFILSKGQIFLSYWHHKNNQPINNFEQNFAQINDPNDLDFRRDLDYYWIYA